MAASGATTASKQPLRSNMTSDLKSVTPITYLSIWILLIWYGPFLAASEVTTASKQPQRSNLTSDFKSVTPVTYLSMWILFIWYGPSWQPLRPLQPPNSLGGQNWVCRWNWWPQFTIWPSFKVALLVKKWLFARRRRRRWQSWPIDLRGFAAGNNYIGQDKQAGLTFNHKIPSVVYGLR